MAGYTRQSTASILNGRAITAPPLTAEFDQLASAFSSTSGHSHDGTSGNSPKINLVTSVSGFLPAANGGIGGKNKSDATAAPVATNDTTEGYAVGSLWTNVSTGRVYICIVNTSNAAVWRELVQVKDGNSILPVTNDSIDLGSNSLRFQDLFLSGGISSSGNSAIGGTLSITGNTTVGGTIGVTGDATFANLTATGTTTITSVDLNSGAVDNAPIGTTTPAAGTFTTLNANTSLVAATADINGGTVDGAAIGANTPSTGSFTTLGASGTTTLATVDINGGAIDGTAIGASGASTGAFTTVSTSGQATLATVDIGGGAIDGTTIGATATSSGAFTTLSASGGITGALTGNVTGNTAGVHTGAVTGNVTGNLTGNVTASSGSSTFNDVVVNGNLNMNAGTSATITNLTAPSSDLDAATKKYVDDEISTLIGDAGAGLNTLGELADALNDDDDFSTTVTNSIASKLSAAGGTMTGAIAMGTSKITGLGDPTANQDAATKAYTDTQRDTRLATSGGTMSGALAMGNSKITGLATPTATTDATTKTYVDGLFQSTTSASTSATNAATSETNAATSESNASTSATAAQGSATSAAASLDLFDDRMLGAKSSAPSVDNDGNALVAGTLYFDTTASAMKVYSGSGWVNAGSSVNGTTNRYSYTATAGQTTFAATYDAGYVDVFLNGVKQVVGTDVTATSGSSVVFASGTTVNDVVEIIGYGTFVLADHLTETQSDAKYLQLSGGTLTGDLTVDTNTLHVDSSNNRVGIGTSPSYTLDIASSGTLLNMNSTNSNGIGTVYRNSGTAIGYVGSSKYIHSGTIGDFAIGTASTNNLTFGINSSEKMRINSSGNVGIGEENPLDSLSISSSAGNAAIRLKRTDTTIINNDIYGAINFAGDDSDTNASGIRGFIRGRAQGTGGGMKMEFHTAGGGAALVSEPRMTLNADGDVIINHNANNAKLMFNDQSNSTGIYLQQIGSSGSPQLRFFDSAAGSETMRLSSGRVMIGTTTEGSVDTDELTLSGSGRVGMTIRSTDSNSSRIYFSDATSGAGEYVGYLVYDHTTDHMRLGTSSQERLRIHSAGRVGIGTTGDTIQGSLVVKDVTDHNGSDVFIVAQNGTANRVAGYKVRDEGGNTALQMSYDNGGNKATITNPHNGNLAIRLGGTGSGNELSEYEEGTFTYTMSTGTSGGYFPRAGYTIGHYTKIGNTVHYQIRFESLGSSSPQGRIQITNFPYTFKANITNGAASADTPCLLRGLDPPSDHMTYFFAPVQNSNVGYFTVRENDSTHGYTVIDSSHIPGNWEGILNFTALVTS